MNNTSFLDEVLEGIQPEVITSLQGKLDDTFTKNLQIETRKCAITLLGLRPHAIVCLGTPGREEKTYLCVPYEKNPDDTFDITGQIMKITPEQVVQLKQR
jgi:4-hydroxy-L-threonine phosphate dehydrogenase PdxA